MLWPRANFSPAEIACRGTAKLLVNEAALDKLQVLRDRLAKPLILRSAYRGPEHNRAVGGPKRSKHLEGAASDIAMANHDPHALAWITRAGDEFNPHPEGAVIFEILGDRIVIQEPAWTCRRA